MIFGALAALVGLVIALFPWISAWRVSGRVLDELPMVSAAGIHDDRHRLAIPDPDFVLATRTYEGLAADEVEAALLSGGFQSISAGTERWLSKNCCGEYDAVWVQVRDVHSGSATATLTVADSDVQLAWPFFLVFGLPMTLGGTIGAVAALRKTDTTGLPAGNAGSTPIAPLHLK
jgi:hypothetical protein